MVLKVKDLKFSLLDVESFPTIYSYALRIIFVLEDHKRNICGLYSERDIILIIILSVCSPTTVYY